MSETAPPYGAPPPAGYYTLRATGRMRPLPAWEVLSARLNDPDVPRTFQLDEPQWLNATEAAIALAVAPPAGLALVYTEPPRG